MQFHSLALASFHCEHKHIIDILQKHHFKWLHYFHLMS